MGRRRSGQGLTPGGKSHKILRILHGEDAGFRTFAHAIFGLSMTDPQRKRLWHLLGRLEAHHMVFKEGNLFAITPTGEKERQRLDALLIVKRAAEQPQATA